jgi:regulator of sigma D
MLNKFKQVQQEWGGQSAVIDHWLETRQQLIVEYCKLLSIKPNAAQGIVSLPTSADMASFCGHLVDYISEGHFKIYDMVMDRWSATGFKTNEEIDTAYSKIVLTTEPLLEFTDTYADNANLDETNVIEDLSKIGEILELRFEVEDALIQLIADSLAVPPGA